MQCTEINKTLSNEFFDLPHYLLGDPPTTNIHRFGEMSIEVFIFIFIALFQLFFNKHLINKLNKLQQVTTTTGNYRKNFLSRHP